MPLTVLNTEILIIMQSIQRTKQDFQLQAAYVYTNTMKALMTVITIECINIKIFISFLGWVRKITSNYI